MAAKIGTGESFTCKANNDARDIGQFFGLLGKHQGKDKEQDNINNYCYEGARPPGLLVGVYLVPGTFDHASKDDFARKAWHQVGLLAGRSRSRTWSRPWSSTSAKKAKKHRSQEGSEKEQKSLEENSDI